MAAYLLRIGRETCRTCGVAATVRLFNTFNTLAGAYCKRHGGLELRAMEARDRAAHSGPGDSPPTASRG